MNDYERTIVANVGRFGWHCTSVSSAADLNAACFAYTVGLFYSYRQPEFIILGLGATVSHSILAVLANAAAARDMYPLDQPCHDLIENYPCVFVEVPKRAYGNYVFSAMWYHAGDAFPLYQIVWPDSHGRFPWHEAATDEFRKLQPVLGANSA